MYFVLKIKRNLLEPAMKCYRKSTTNFLGDTMECLEPSGTGICTGT